MALTHAVKYGGSTEREKARTKLLLSNLRLLMKVAGEFNNRGLSREELINEGSFGLLDAAERFRPDGGARFSSYSVWRIRQAIRRALARQGRTVRIPLRTLENIYRMRRIEREFLNTYGRTPDMAELADLLGCSSVVLLFWTVCRSLQKIRRMNNIFTGKPRSFCMKPSSCFPTVSGRWWKCVMV